MSYWSISSFENTFLKIFWRCPHNVTWLQKTKDDKMLTIDNFFFFKCAINLNENFRIAIRKTKIYPLHIRFLHMFWYRNITGRAKNLFLLKNLTRKNIKISTSPKIWAKCKKTSFHWKKWTLTFNIRQNVFCFRKSKFKKVNSPKHVCLRVYHQFNFYKNVLKSFLIQRLIK